MRGIWRYLWAAPATLLGLTGVLAALPRGQVAVVDGVLEAHGPAVAWMLRRLMPRSGGALAVTLGHVVLARDERTLARTRGHERVHVEQYERWGPLFVPAYVLASAWAALHGAHPYLDNVFEREAFSRAPSAGTSAQGIGRRSPSRSQPRAMR